jgi:type III secretory pathway component EscR
MTLLSFVPAALVMMTSFTRIAIVFHFLRQAIGTQEMPSNQMVVGLTLFLTAFIMAPTVSRINELAIQPADRGQIDTTDGARRAARRLARLHAEADARGRSRACSSKLSRTPRPATPAELPMRVVIPAFAISELKTGFQMGFFIFIPFCSWTSSCHHAAVDGHAAAAADDGVAAVQGAAVRDDRRLEPARGFGGPQFCEAAACLEAVDVGSDSFLVVVCQAISRPRFVFSSELLAAWSSASR